MVTGGVTAEAVRSLSKAEEAEVWAQDRVSVSRAAVTKHCKLDDLKQQKFIISLLPGGYRSQIQVLAGP